MLIDNKKTREISWNDFELEGNKENLIKQGWESFEPYGFGEFIGKAPEEVFDENYCQTEVSLDNLISAGPYIRERHDFGYIVSIASNASDSVNNINNALSLDESDFNIGDKIYARTSYVINETSNIRQATLQLMGDRNIDTKSEGFLNNESFFLSGVTAIGSVSPSGLNARVSFKDRNSLEDVDVYFYNYIFINLTKVFGEGNEPSKEWCDENIKYYPNWQDLTDEEKPVNAYEKGYTYVQPLDNGFTRIRTKGGDTDMKLKSPNFGQLAETGTDMTISLYVENNSDSTIRFSNNLAIGGIPYPDGVEYMITVPSDYKGFAYLKGELVGGDVELDIRSDGNVDMIVSQPEIIEGHDLNAMLVIEDLDDGRKHVQVHNVNENTKLVYTGDNVIKGEPYTLETEIENDGRIFNLSANMFDDKVEVQKGMNDIRKSGELQDKELKIEIGVD